jgi:hypothetical protein
MTVLAQRITVNQETDAWWADLAAANDDGTCGAVLPSSATPPGAAAVGLPCDADDGPRAPDSPWSMRDPSRHPAHASAMGCPDYPGDLWRDVLDYRAIRAQSLAGLPATQRERERLAALEGRLRGQTDDARRLFLRFACRYHATLELAKGERFAALVLDASAGGAKVTAPGDAREGDPVVLELATEGLAGSVALPARVIWVRDGYVGLMFAGAARWR